MKFTPEPYQIKAEHHVIDNPRCGLGLDMGLGKTVTTLNAFQVLKYEMGAVQSMVVVAPLSVALLTWRQEIKKWDHLQHLVVRLLHGNDKDEQLRLPADIYLINYEGLQWLKDRLANKKIQFPQRIDMVVFDESTRIKNKTAVCSQISQALSFGVERAVILSGSPTPNSLLDIWHQIYVLDAGERLGKAYTKFRAENFINDGEARKWFPRRGGSDRIARNIEDIFLTMRSEDYLDLPPRIVHDVPVLLPDKYRKMYDELESKFILDLGNTEITALSASSLSMKLRQFVQGFVYDEEKQPHAVHKEKLEALRDIVNNTGSNILVAVQFRHEYEMIREYFKKDFEVPVIRGGISSAEKADIMLRWNNGQIPLLVGNAESVSLGLNMQFGGNIIVWYSLLWNYGTYIQFNKRIHRKQQTKPVYIYRLIMDDTIDEVMKAVLNSKGAMMTKLLDAVIELRERRTL